VLTLPSMKGVGSCAPRSGLSRSDFVQWPTAETTAADRHGRSLGYCGRQSRAIGVRATEQAEAAGRCTAAARGWRG
jgi:hypothetical protein